MATSVVARVVGVVLVLAAGVAMYWLTSADSFRLDPLTIRISGLANTTEAEVRDRLGLDPASRPNVFRLHATAMADAVRALPSVESANVVVALPNQVDVLVVEREPLLSWTTDTTRFAVDKAGLLLTRESLAFPPDDLPQVHDGRLASQDLDVGDRIGEIEMTAARLLLTITPADVGSQATALALAVSDDDGFVLSADHPAWRAVFGFYSANQLQPGERVPRQRQCLASILATNGEDRLEVVYLAVTGDACGSYREQPTFGGQPFQNVRRPGA